MVNNFILFQALRTRGHAPRAGENGYRAFRAGGALTLHRRGILRCRRRHDRNDLRRAARLLRGREVAWRHQMSLRGRAGDERKARIGGRPPSFFCALRTLDGLDAFELSQKSAGRSRTHRERPQGGYTRCCDIRFAISDDSGGAREARCAAAPPEAGHAGAAQKRPK